MVNSVKLKRSTSSGAVPTTAQLQLGELAINTYDGRLFTKKNNGADAIVEFVSNAGTWGINVSGSAATLTTARTINGTSFNGSANITTANWGTARTLTIGNTGKSVDGAGNVAWSLAEIGALPLTGGTLSGDLSASSVWLSGYLACGNTSGSVALTYNDGYGNCNVAFNHRTGVPDVSGSSARITSGVDSATGYISFQVKNSTTANTAIALPTVLTLAETSADFYVPLTVAGNLTSTAVVQGTSLVSTIVTGTAPLTIASTTAVTNLNADMVDGSHRDTAFNSFGNGTIPVRHSAGYLFSNYFNCTANDETAVPTRVAIETANDRYIRWQTIGQFRLSLGLVDHVTGSPASLDTQQLFQFGRSTAVSGLTFSGGDSRLLTATVDPSNVILWRAYRVGLQATDYVSLKAGVLEVLRGSSDGSISIGSGSLSVSGTITAPGFISTRLTAVGPPLSVTSTAVCTNLNADMVDGLHASTIVHGGGTLSASLSAPATWSSTSVSQYKSGFWDAAGAAWTPDTGWWWGLTMAHTSNGPDYNYGAQIIVPNGAGHNPYVRHIGGAIPGPWHKIWTSGNDGAGSTLDADMVDGKHVGSSGNTIPLLDQANTWSARQVSSFTGNNGQTHLSMFNDANGVTAHWYTNSSSFYLLMSDVGTVPTNNYNALRPFTVNLTTGAVTMSNGLTATLTGNASTATTLQTARTINGTSFNGSANITTANWGTSRALSIGLTSKAVNGSGDVNWSLSEIGALPLTGGSIAGQLFVTYSGLGGPAIDVTGDVAATGGVSASTMSADSFYANVAPTVPTELTSKDYVDAKATKDNCAAATFNPIPYGVFDSLTGTITVTYTPFTFTSVASDSITLTGHQFNTGDAVRLAPSVNDASNYLSVNGTAQAVGNTSNRYVIKVDANTIKIATGVPNALAGTATTVTITGTVTVTVNIAAVIDGQTIGADSRVLVKSQTAAAANGIYFMSTTTQNAWVLSRAQDADAWSDLVAALVPISQGIINTGSLWLCTIGSSGTLNTGSITFKALGSKDITYGQPNSASPTITAVGPIQASKFIRDQGAPATQNNATTLTSAQIAAGILQTTPTGAIALTLPTGTTMEENAVTTGEAYDFYIINTSAYAVTINGNTGHTIVGNATIAANTSAHWCIRKTATNTFVSYRVA